MISASTASRLIPQPDWVTNTVHQDGDTMDIINALLAADGWKNNRAAKSMSDVANNLESDNPYSTLYNVWTFVHTNIRYKADEDGHEKIKDPSYLYHSGEGDCKSFSLMIGAILRNYPNIGFSYRFVSYPGQKNFSHVYVIAKMPDRKKEIILDAVHTKFDEEVPYHKKMDKEMTKISHLHGIGLIGNARPTAQDVISNAPRKVYNAPVIPVGKLTQGQIEMELIKRDVSQLIAYYGDLPELVNALNLVNSSLRNPSKIEIPNYLPTELNGLASKLISLSHSHNDQLSKLINAFDSVNMRSSISGVKLTAGNLNITEQQLRECMKNHSLSEAGWWYRNSNTGSDPHHYIELDGKYYALSMNSTIWECFKLAKQQQWAKNNIFEKESFKLGSHHMLYEFISTDDINQNMSSTGATKAQGQKEYVAAFAGVSGLNQSIVQSYVRTGIQYTCAANKMQVITPEDNILGLKDGVQYIGQQGINSQIGVLPVAAVVAIIGAIGTAVAKIIVAIKSGGPTFESTMLNNARGINTDVNSSAVSDFEKKIFDLSNINSMIPLAAGAGIIFLLLNKKSKK
ncbi:MAG TPA: hypothetical protein PK006_12320 [Saprospiraceae bacterium]|nr:hypothetical protein [Saprospiraceae bacterium]